MCPNEQLLTLAHERTENVHEQSETKVVRHPLKTKNFHSYLSLTEKLNKVDKNPDVA